MTDLNTHLRARLVAWQVEHPGLHRVYTLSGEGWKCLGCSWGNHTTMGSDQAVREHDYALNDGKHWHEQWAVINLEDGDHCWACGELITTPRFPELQRVKEMSDKIDTVSNFLEWLRDKKGLVLARSADGGFDDTPASVLLVDYFGIDKEKIDAEWEAAAKADVDRNALLLKLFRM